MTLSPDPRDATKPTWSELQQIEADYDPEKDVITERVYGLLSRAERPRRNVTGRERASCCLLLIVFRAELAVSVHPQKLHGPLSKRPRRSPPCLHAVGAP